MRDIIGINRFFRPWLTDHPVPLDASPPRRDGSRLAVSQTTTSELTDRVEWSELGTALAGRSEGSRIRLGTIAEIRAAIDAEAYETPLKIATVVDRLLEQLGE